MTVLATDTPTAPQLRMLLGMLRGRTLNHISYWQVGFEGGETFSRDTMFACLHRGWIARGEVPNSDEAIRQTLRNTFYVYSLSALGCDAIARAAMENAR